MSLNIIRGLTATSAGVKLTPSGGSLEDWSPIMQSARIRWTLPQVDATTYSNETNGNFLGGIERATIDLTGLMTRDAAVSGLIVPSVYQGATVLITYDGATTGCSVSAVANCTDAEGNRPAGAMGVISATFVTTGTITVTWDKT